MLTGFVSNSSLSTDEREWVLQGMAWVGLRRWRYGRDAGDQAREWFEEQMDLRFDARHAARYVSPALGRLEAEICGLVGRAVYGGTSVLGAGPHVRADYGAVGPF